MRKSKLIAAQVDKALVEFRRVNKAKEQAEATEALVLENTKAAIDELCKKEDLYCGVILSKEDLVAVLQIMLATNEQVKIDFRLYHKDIETPQVAEAPATDAETPLIE